MEKDVIISISGVQALVDEEREKVELVTAGKFSRFKDGYALSYMESALVGLEGTRTTFQVEKDKITLVRAGSVNSQMVFEKGKKHFSLYETDYGSMTIGVSAKRVDSSLDDNGGEIDIKYSIEIDHELAGENSFHIQVREPAKNLLQ
jgi:uncharacterized beta-barrel protein YwiB (DUF1934 family)